VGSCTLELGGTLDLLEDGAACEDCDRSYQGSLAVEGGDCPPDYIEPPSTGTYGFLFVSLGERELWKFDDDEAAWESLGEVQASGNVWQLEHSSPVLYDVPLFGPTEVGMFTVHETLTDL